jgi:septum site-determining protein MinC
VDRPLRSGQRVYAGTDIVVLDMVSYGAEVIADGNVHVYAPLRGRAVAGPAATPAQDFQHLHGAATAPSQVSTAQLKPIPKDVAGKPPRCAWREKVVIEPV